MKKRIAAVALSAGLMMGVGAIGATPASAATQPNIAQLCALYTKYASLIPPQYQAQAAALAAKYCPPK